MVNYLSTISAIQWKKRSSKAMRRDNHEIPFDFMIEILRRLPAKSLMRFKCVSKHWSGLIRSRYFSNLYLLTNVSSPLSPPRPLGLYMSLTSELHFNCDSMERCNNPGKSELLSLSVSSSSNNAEPSLEADLSLPEIGGHKMEVLRGLILYTVCRKACIYNPTTRQSLTLPAVKSNLFAQQEPHHKRVNYFFGHDPVHDQYKIVCNVVVASSFWARITTEYWVFVREPGGFWKRIEHDDQSHFPQRQGICINGVIYYMAFGHTCGDAIYTFDVRSEKFHRIQAPHEVSSFRGDVVFIEHGGKPALFDYVHIKKTGVSELWVLEDSGTWSRKTLVLKPCQRHLVKDINTITLMVHGTGQNNEVILVLPKTCYILYYDLINNDLRKVNINRERPPGKRPYMYVNTMDKCESIMHLET